MTYRAVDGHIFFGPVLTLVCDRKAEVAKLVSHLLSQGHPFSLESAEGYYYVSVSEDTHLDRIRSGTSAKWKLQE